MAEICLDCRNRINDRMDPPARYVLSRELELCGGCSRWKPVIVKE